MIYFVLAPNNQRLKIGYTAGDPKARLTALQTGSCELLELIGVTEGEKADEAAWHKRFHHLRTHREWFEWIPELRRAVRPHMIAKPADPIISQWADIIQHEEANHGLKGPYPSQVQAELDRRKAARC